MPRSRSVPTVRADERPAWSDLELLDREGELAVRQRAVDEVGDPRARGQLRDLMARAGVRGDRAVRARLQQLGLGAIEVGPGHDEQVGRHRPRREGDVDVERVGVDRGDEAPGVLDPGVCRTSSLVASPSTTRWPSAVASARDAGLMSMTTKGWPACASSRATVDPTRP